MSWTEELRRREAAEYGREDIARIKAMLLERGAKDQLEAARRSLGGSLVVKERAIPQPHGSVSHLTLGLIRISKGQTTHHEGGGYSFQVFGADPEGGQIQPFNFDQTLINVTLVGIGMAKHRKTGGLAISEEIFLVAKEGNLVLREDRLRPTPREAYRATLSREGVPPGPRFTLTGPGENEIFDNDLLIPRVTESGQLNLDAVDFFTGRTGSFQPTSDPSADCLRIEGLVTEAVQAVQSSR